jgi:hypothetical protein
MARELDHEIYVMSWFKAGVPITLLMDLASPLHSRELYLEELVAA